MAFNGSVTISGATSGPSLVGVSDNGYASTNLAMFKSLTAQYAAPGFNNVTNSDHLLYVSNSFGSVGVTDVGSSSTIVVGDSSNLTYIGGSGDATLITGTGDVQILAGSGNDTVALGSGTDRVVLGSGNSEVSVAGAQNIIQAGSGSANITLTGIGATVDGGYNAGSGALSVDDTQGVSSTINVINGALIKASELSTTDVNAYGNATVSGGPLSKTDYNQLNAKLFFEGTGASLTVTGGANAGIDTLYAASGSTVVYDSSTADNVFVGNDSVRGDGGSVYIDAGLTSVGNQFWAGSGNTTLLGGTGTDTLVAGAGDDTITGGSGAFNYFDFFASNGGSGTAVTVTDFGAVSGNQLTLFDYGTSQYNAVVSSAPSAVSVVTSGPATGIGTTISLSDGSRIFLQGYTGGLSTRNVGYT